MIVCAVSVVIYEMCQMKEGKIRCQTGHDVSVSAWKSKVLLWDFIQASDV